jgi:hypothetical protein
MSTRASLHPRKPVKQLHSMPAAAAEATQAAPALALKPKPIVRAMTPAEIEAAAVKRYIGVIVGYVSVFHEYAGDKDIDAVIKLDLEQLDTESLKAIAKALNA